MDLIETYKAFADESRLRIIHALSRGQFNVQELTSILNLGQSTVSHHLKVLQQADVASPNKQGTWTYYTLNDHDEIGAGEFISTFLKRADKLSAGNLSSLLARDRKEIGEIENQRRDKGHRFFESVAKNWDNIRNASGDDQELLAKIASLVPQEGSLLEVGCGSGALLEKVLPRIGAVIGVDFSQAMLDQARSHLERDDKTADLRLGYLEHLPLGDAAVDIVISYMVVHHLSQPKDALRDVYRVLKPGGKIMICDLVAHENEEMRERYGDLWLGFDPEEMQRWLKEIGFRKPQIDIVGNGGTAFLLTCSK